MIPGDTQCPTNCSYHKNDNKEQIWCFKQKNVYLNYTAECPKCPGSQEKSGFCYSILKGDWGNIYPCPLSQEELLDNLTSQMKRKLVQRYENQRDELEAYIENLNALNDTIKNITAENKDTRIISDCSTFAEFLQKNLSDLEFKRRVEQLL